MKTLISSLIVAASIFTASSVCAQYDHEPKTTSKMSANSMPLVRPDQIRGISLEGKNCVAKYNLSGGKIIDLKLIYPRDDSSKSCNEIISSERPKYIWINRYVKGNSDEGKLFELNYELDSNYDKDIIPELYDFTGVEKEV